MDYYTSVLKKYAVLSGRARRKEYWMFTLINIIVSIILGVIDGAMDTNVAVGSLGLLGTIYSLAVLVPSIAVLVRRLHDTDRSGWWALLCLIPIVGWIILLVFAVLDSTPGTNRFGENPKGTSPSAPSPAASV